MKLIKHIGTFAFIAVFGMSVIALAQQPGSGMMKQDREMDDRQQQGMRGKGMMEMCEKMCQKMQGMSGDPKMMEGMQSQHQFMSEMKKHLREMKKHLQLLDEMMDGMMDNMMMRRQQGMVPPAGPGSEQQEHHPGESK